MKLKTITLSLLFIGLLACNQSKKEESSEGTETTEPQTEETSETIEQGNGVYFVSLKDGEMLKSPVIVEMGVKGMEVEPAGKINEGKGHHHIIIDDSYVEAGMMVAKDEKHLHFGNGQISDTLTLSPGKHTLTLQFANGAHQSYGKDWSKTITIDVTE